MSKDLLLEIGTEEIPSAFIPTVLANMMELMGTKLEENRILYGNIKTLGTQRRLVVFVSGMSERQEDRITRIIGPPKSVGYDESGRPTKAAEGFAKGKGVQLSDIEVIETEKGEYLRVTKRQKGLRTFDLLPNILCDFILSIPFPRSMRWANLSIRFVRPIHWILAIFNGEVVPFTLGNLSSGDISFGHRFVKPQPTKIEDIGSYIKKMRDAYVIVDPMERKAIVERDITESARKVSGVILPDEGLLDVVTHSVEYPAVVCGSFDQKFLKLPREVLIAAMREHQRYFTVVDKDGNPMPYFVAVNNTPIEDPQTVTHGHERVLAARLSDAQFFFEADQKIPLKDRLEQLKGVIFHSELGNSYEKATRIQELAVFLAEILSPEKVSAVKKAAQLCKTDLVTEIVKEFPRLQGTMGKIYALLSGEPEEVAHAIYEHYLPQHAGGELPSSHVGAIVSIADKMDTICGCFGIGLIPSGTADPYGLRRQALGIIHIIRDKGYALSLTNMIKKSLSLFRQVVKEDTQEVAYMVKEFVGLRLHHQLISENYPYDVVESVLSIYSDDILDSIERIKALNYMRLEGKLEPLVISFKRVANIAGMLKEGVVDPSLFKDPVESHLYEHYTEVSEEVEILLKKKTYFSILTSFSGLREPIDRFFDGVLVMASDEGIRNNRLALLGKIYYLFMRLADLSKIVA